MVRDRVDRVGDREDSGADGDLLAREPIRVTVPVPALVVRPDDLDPRLLQERDTTDHLRAEQGVRLHHTPLGLVQGARLQEDLVGNADLADVVEQKAVLEGGIGGETSG